MASHSAAQNIAPVRRNYRQANLMDDGPAVDFLYSSHTPVLQIDPDRVFPLFQHLSYFA